MGGEINEGAATYLGSGFALFGLGMVGGVYQVFRQEKVKFNRNTHGRPALVAARALFFGTVLAVGTFGIGVGAFIKISGITSFKEFGQVCSDLCRPLYVMPSAEQVAESEKEVTQLEEYFDAVWNGKEAATVEATVAAGSGEGAVASEDSSSASVKASKDAADTN